MRGLKWGAGYLIRFSMARPGVILLGAWLGVLLSAVLLTRLLGDLLYRVSPRDPFAFGAAFGAMMIASILACLLPAWRATRTDPCRALRE